MLFLPRVKQARLVRVLLVYLGASWVVVEVADLLQEALDLPEWVVPVAIILLLVGLVVVMGTAWVQAQPATDRREARGEVPSDWELDLPDLARTIRQGRLPHPTWSRALVGGAGAFFAMFFLAALVVISGLNGGSGPDDAADAMAAPGLAVLPFRVSGQGLDGWRDGLVDLLSRNLDGLGGLRAIDSRTVLARWDETVGDAPTPDLATALTAAGRTGARWALVGSAVESGAEVRVAADIHEVETGRRLDGVAAEGEPDSLLSLVDRLSVEIARALLEREDTDLTRLRLSSITTSSPEALRAFLEGEAGFRQSTFRPAAEAYERAVELDPRFALAWYRLGAARGWSGAGGAGSARARAYEHRARLPARERLLVEADYRARRGALPSGVALLRDGVRRYPDDPELWYELGDVYLHYGPQLLLDRDEARRALERAAELDPGFAPYQIHLVDLALVSGDSAEAAGRLEREDSLTRGGGREVRAHRLQFDYLYGTAGDRERVLAALDTLGERTAAWLRVPLSLDGEQAAGILELANAICESRLREEMPSSGAYRWNCLYTLLANGRVERARHHAATMASQGMLVIPSMVGLVLRRTGMDPSAPIPDPGAVLARPGPPAGLVDPALLSAGMVAAFQGRPALADSVTRVLADSAAARTVEGDTLSARIIAGLGEGVEGHWAMAEDREGAALRHLERSHAMVAGGGGPETSFLNHVAWSLAELYGRAGRHREALRYLESLGRSHFAAPALLRRADLHERLGEGDRAVELRRAFLAMWSGADPDHPMVREARRGLPPG